MQVGILGPLTVEVDGRSVPVAGVRLRSLVTRLSLDAPRVVSADELVDDLWGDDPPAERANALQSLVSRTRRSLGTGSIMQVGNGYRLAVDRDDIDAHRFTVLCRQGTELLEREPTRAREILTSALQLWRGDPLADAREADYALGPARRLLDLKISAQADVMAASVKLGDGAGVLADIQELAAANPLSERLIALHMRALAAAGRPAEALDLYQRARTYLAQMLGADPSAELQQLHLELLQGNDPASETPTPLTTARDNLPVALTGFIGRDNELARIDELLEQARLVTVIGPGGVGKTRLAVEAAARREARHPDGRWLVPLASVTDPAGIVPAFLDALQLRSAPSIDRRESSGRDATERLTSSLGRVSALLIVDNCEHLVTDVADLVDVIAQRCPDVRIIATSREPLGLLGEALFPVPPLAVPTGGSGLDRALKSPAVQLLSARANAVHAGFTVTEENLPSVLEIVRRLDGLPLAIELAAARLRLLPPVEVASLLSDRFRLLSGGNRAALPRHRTLWAVVDWSWDLLDQTERLVAERLSVLAGTWTVPAAAALCAGLGLDQPAVRDTLLSLADKSLLDTPDGASFRMLETIRDYSLVRCAESGGLDAARLAHATHYEDLARRFTPKLRGAAQLDALAALQVAHADILDAIRFLTDSGQVHRARTMAVRMMWFWIITDRGFEFIDQLTELSRMEPVEDRTALTLAAFALMGDMGMGTNVDDIDRYRRSAVVLAERMTKAGPPTGTAALIQVLLYFFAGQGEIAMDLTDRFVATSVGRWARGTAQLMFAMFAENIGDLDVVRERMASAARELAGQPDRWSRASLASIRSRIALADGDLDGAIADAEFSLTVLNDLGAGDDEIQARLMLSQLYSRQGDFERAHQQIELMKAVLERSSMSVSAPMGGWRNAVGVGRLAVYESQRDDVRAAAVRQQLMAELDTDVRPDGHISGVGWSVVAMSWARAGHLDEAVRALHFAYSIVLATEDHPVIAAVGEATAVVTARAGLAEIAVEMLGAAGLVRGGQDINDPILAPVVQLGRKELGDNGFDGAYARGRQLTKEQALHRIDPAALDEAVSGPQSPEPAARESRTAGLR